MLRTAGSDGTSDPRKNPVAVELGRRGGLKGGRARAEQLTPEQRRAIALKAAQARWGAKGPAAPDVQALPMSQPTPVVWPAASASGPVPEDVNVEEPARSPAPPAAPAADAAVSPLALPDPETNPAALAASRPPAPDPASMHPSPMLSAQASISRREPSLAEWEALSNLPGPESPGQLRLADWRRRVADLYSEVRRLAQADPEEAWRLWRAVRELLYRRHPLSPVPADGRAAFTARHFPYDQALRFEVPVQPDAYGRSHTVGGPSNSVVLPNSGQEMLAFERVGRVELSIGGEAGRLSLFWITGYAGGLFLPFRDATNGAETYGAGRYLLDTAKGADLGGGSASGTIVLDFNFAFHPSCAFDPRWSCPLAPPENRLEMPIRVGERMA